MKAAALNRIKKMVAGKILVPKIKMNTMAFRNPPLRFAPPKKLLAFATLMSNLLALAVPVMTLQVYDRMLVSYNVATLQVLVVGVIIAVIFDVVLRLARSYVVNWAGAVYEHTVACNALRHMLSAEMGAVQSENMGVHIQRLGDISKLREFFSGQALLTLIDLPFVFVFLVLIAWLAGALVIVPILLLCLFAGIAIMLGESLKSELVKREKADSARLGFIIASLEGIHGVKALAAEPYFLRCYEALQESSSRASYLIAKQNALSGNCAGIFSQAMTIGGIGFGSVMAANGTITMGTLIACVLLSGRIMQPVQRALALWSRFQDLRLAMSNVNEIFSMQAEERSDIRTNAQRGGVLEIRNMSFGYAGAPLLFQNIDLTLERGESIALTGRHSLAKSTFLHLLAGLQGPLAGEILIDGVPVTRFPARELVRHVGYLPMEGIIFRGTIRENLSAFSEYKDEEVMEISRLLGLDAEVRKLPAGYETNLAGTQADPIPPGLRQRIAIARALAPKPRIILFNNADRALDREGYNQVYRLLARLQGKATMIIVTDDRNIAQIAKRDYTLEEGQLITADFAGAERLQTALSYQELRL